MSKQGRTLTLLLAYAMSGPVPVRSEEMVISCCLVLLDVLWVKWVGNDRGRQLVPNWDDGVGKGSAHIVPGIGRKNIL